MRQQDLGFGGVLVPQPQPPKFFRDLSEAELQAHLVADTPGAQTEESLRATLAAHPEIRRENIECSWGPSCVPQSSL